MSENVRVPAGEGGPRPEPVKVKTPRTLEAILEAHVEANYRAYRYFEQKAKEADTRTGAGKRYQEKMREKSDGYYNMARAAERPLEEWRKENADETVS